MTAALVCQGRGPAVAEASVADASGVGPYVAVVSVVGAFVVGAAGVGVYVSSLVDASAVGAYVARVFVGTSVVGVLVVAANVSFARRHDACTTVSESSQVTVSLCVCVVGPSVGVEDWSGGVGLARVHGGLCSAHFAMVKSAVHRST